MSNIPAHLRARIGVLLQQGFALHQAGKFLDAIGQYRQVLKLAPRQFDALHLRGVALFQLGRQNEALKFLDQALLADPQADSALYHRGLVLRRLGRPDEALDSFRRAIARRPDYAEALKDAGAAAVLVGLDEEAAGYFARAAAARPGDADAAQRLAIALDRLGRTKEAEAAYARLLELQPDNVVALINRGHMLQDLGQFDRAMEFYGRALAIEPDNAAAHFNAAIILLMRGDFARGLDEFEWRWKNQTLSEADELTLARHAMPRWTGAEALAGRRLLIEWEQGLGDTIQFARFAILAAEQGATVTLRVQEALARLLRNLHPGVTVIGEKEAIGAFDLWSPLMSMPWAFGTRLETLPVPVPYLAPDAERVAHWRGALAAMSQPRVGLVFAGNAQYRNDRQRSIPPRLLAPLAACGVALVSLQKDVRAGDAADFAALGAYVFAEAFDDLSEAAALVAALDVVITVDTAMAHLAGAMGKSVWVLLSRSVDWRWLLEREDSPWYPAARLFRQQTLGDWAEVIERVAAALRSLAARAG